MDKRRIKVWVDDVRWAPVGYVWVRSVNECVRLLQREDLEVTMLDLDHDAGAYFWQGGDYIKILDWMEENGVFCAVHLHTMNPVGRQNMERIIKRNGWRYLND